MEWPADLGRAIRFLTLLSPGADRPAPGGTAGSLYLFPVAGLLIGSLAVVSGMIAHLLFGPPVHAVAAVAVAVVVTGGLHLDGLADTSDAVLSWRDRERRLEIMRDSRIGAMGAIALVLVIALKIAALLALAGHWWLGALISPAFGRWADVYGIARFPAARNEGLAAGVRAAAGDRQLTRATAMMVIIAAPLCFWGEWYLAVPAALAAFAVMHWLAAALSKSFGGLTGDMYGALSETGEVAALLAVCVVLT